jgi:hypothetical protein
VQEPALGDADATIGQFERVLDRRQRVRHMREVRRSIAELQEQQGAQSVPGELQTRPRRGRCGRARDGRWRSAAAGLRAREAVRSPKDE